MEYTKNYHLPQWAESDRILMGDFNQAMDNIDRGLASAVYTAGTYTGNGVNMDDGGQEIPLGFRPRFVIITRGWVESQTVSTGFFAAGENMVDKANNYIRFTDSGFCVGLSPNNANITVKLNTADIPYSFIAFQ